AAATPPRAEAPAFSTSAMTAVPASALTSGKSTGPAAAAAPRPEAAADKFSFKQKESAANTIFQRLRRELGAIPEWMGALGTAQPALYFAKKILTPGVVEGLLDGLMPLYRELLVDGAPRAEETAASAWAVADVFRLLSIGGRTGELRIFHGGQ